MCLHDSILALELPEVLVGGGVALVKVEVNRYHSVLQQAFEVKTNPVSSEPYRCKVGIMVSTQY